MPIYRVHADRYTIVGNEILESETLSWKAKGLLAYMLGRPDKWEFSEKALYTMFPDGQTSTRSGIKELEDAGYLYRERVRESGKVAGCVWHVFQRPMSGDKIHDLIFQTGQIPTGETTNNKELNIEITEQERTKEIGQADFSDEIEEVVSYLNAVCGTSFRPKTRETRKKIAARLKDGFTVDDMKLVIDNRNALWSRDAKMREYLRPETLFGTKFEGYLNAAKTSGFGRRADYSVYD